MDKNVKVVLLIVSAALVGILAYNAKTVMVSILTPQAPLLLVNLALMNGLLLPH